MGERPEQGLERLFRQDRPLVGMVHLLPLPGAPRWGGSMAAVLERAAEDATALERGGMDGILVENYLDVPFHPGAVPPETVAALTRAVSGILEHVAVPVGVNVLRNDARSALAIAAATDACFIRVNVHTGSMLTDQGLLEGRAYETLRERARLAPAVRILADVLVKHATPPPGVDPRSVAADAWYRGGADALLVTGETTGSPADLNRVRLLKAAVPDAPVWVASGVTAASVASVLELADGAIVGTALARDGVPGRGVDAARVRRLVGAART